MASPITEMAKDLTLALIKAHLITAADMQQRLVEAHASLLQLKAREDSNLGREEDREAELRPRPPVGGWRTSIKKNSVACLICGAIFKQLSARHLRQHDLDPRTYRQRFGIPSTQPLSAKDSTAKRRQAAQRTRLWETTPSYLKSQEPTPSPTPAQPKRTRKKVVPSSQ